MRPKSRRQDRDAQFRSSLATGLDQPTALRVRVGAPSGGRDRIRHQEPGRQRSSRSGRAPRPHLRPAPARVRRRTERPGRTTSGCRPGSRPPRDRRSDALLFRSSGGCRVRPASQAASLRPTAARQLEGGTRGTAPTFVVAGAVAEPSLGGCHPVPPTRWPLPSAVQRPASAFSPSLSWGWLWARTSPDS